VAGPDPHEGEPVGSVWVAVSLDDRAEARRLRIDGDRQSIRCQTVAAALELVIEVLARE
jgi:nicotinamide mononucleotide (NMN) deamidase PncC